MFTNRNGKMVVLVVMTLVAICIGAFMAMKQDTVVSQADELQTLQYSRAERNVLRTIFEMQDDFEDDEEIKGQLSVTFSYTEIISGVYDIKLMFNIKGDLHEAHMIYDGEEEETILVYGVLDGKRIDLDDWNEYIERKYDLVF